MRRIGLAVMVVVLSGSALALSKGKAVYIGGTISVIKDNTEGLINLSDETKLAFTPKGGIELALPWTRVSEVEYGQKAGRRVVQALVLSPFSLFTKNRKHYVTFNWTDLAGKEQAAVFQLDKNDIRQALAIIRVRTGKDITFTDEEARKQMGGSERKAAPAQGLPAPPPPATSPSAEPPAPSPAASPSVEAPLPASSPSAVPPEPAPTPNPRW